MIGQILGVKELIYAAQLGVHLEEKIVKVVGRCFPNVGGLVAAGDDAQLIVTTVLYATVDVVSVGDA